MHLPVELFFFVARYSRRRTLRSLCLVSRFWHEAAVRELYACVDLVTGAGYQQEVIALGFVCTMLSNPILGSYVQSLDIRTWTIHSRFGRPGSDSLFAPVLRAMPNLRHISVQTVSETDSACEKILFSLTRIESFHAKSCGTAHMNRILDGLPPLRQFVWGNASPDLRGELPPALLRSRNVLEYIDIKSFDFVQSIRSSTVMFPRLQALSTTKRLNLADLQGLGFNSLSCICAHSFDSLSLLEQPSFLPQLRFMHVGVSIDSDVFAVPSSSLEPDTSPRRVLQHLAINFPGFDSLVETSHDLSAAILIFENAEVKSLAMQVGFSSDYNPVLRALTTHGTTMNLRMLSLKIPCAPPIYHTSKLLAKLIEFGAEGHFPNLRFLHLREEPYFHLNGRWRSDPKAFMRAIGSIDELRASSAQAFPSLEIAEFVLICIAWNPTVAIRWTRCRPVILIPEFASGMPVAEVVNVAAAEDGSLVPSNFSGMMTKLLRVIRGPRKTTAVLVASRTQIQTDSISQSLSSQDTWTVEEFDKDTAVPTPWPTRIHDVARFLSVINRYTAV